jgi:large subunit ribosomal protein L4
VPKKVRKLAFSRALTARIEAGDVLTSGPLVVADGKTKTLVASVAKLTDASKVLIIGAFDEVTFRAARNVQPLLLMSPEEVNVEHLLYYDKIVITEDSLGALAARTKGVIAERTAESASAE